MLDPGGGGRTKTGQRFAYSALGRHRSAGRCLSLCADREAERPIAHLSGFKGILQVERYGGYKVLAKQGDERLAVCWSHVRRHLYELAIALDLKDALEAARTWLRTKLQLIRRQSSATRCRWQGLCLFLDDGRIEIDNNVVERSIRPLAMLEFFLQPLFKCLQTLEVCFRRGRDTGSTSFGQPQLSPHPSPDRIRGFGRARPAQPATGRIFVLISRRIVWLMSCCRGLISPLPISKPWPENEAYAAGAGLVTPVPGTAAPVPSLPAKRSSRQRFRCRRLGACLRARSSVKTSI